MGAFSPALSYVATPAVIRIHIGERASLASACADSEPFTFTAALQTHFAVHNLATHARHVRVLGLGGKWIFDYAPDPMHPRLDMEKEDYVTFGGGIPAAPSSPQDVDSSALAFHGLICIDIGVCWLKRHNARDALCPLWCPLS